MAVTLGALKQEIAEAFAQTPYPGDGRLALHDCDKCEGIRQDLRGQTPDTLSDTVIESHHGFLPLLTPEAFRYFLPAHMRYSAEHPDSFVASFTRLSLAPEAPDKYDEFWEERFQLFTQPQRDAVIRFLEFLKAHEIEGDEEDNLEYQEKVEAGIKLWKSLA